MSRFGIQSLRANSRSTFIYVLFGMLIIVFIFTFGTNGPSGCGTSVVSPLVTVYDDVIDARRLTLADSLAPRSQGWWSRTRFVLQPAYAEDVQTLNQLEVMAASRLPIDSPAFESKGWLRFSGFRRATQSGDDDKTLFLINDLVEASLVAREARALGLKASRREIEDRILFDGLYDPDTGVISKESMQNFLSSLGTTKEALASFMADEILREKMIQLVAATVVVSDAEIDAAWSAMNDQVRFEYVGFDPKKLAPLVPVTAEEIAVAAKDSTAIKAWYDGHKGDFQRARATKIRTLLIAAPSQAAIDAEADATKKQDMSAKRADAQQKASELATAIRAESDPEKRREAFTSAVSENSNDEDTKALGGLRDDLLTESDLSEEINPEVAKAAIALEKDGLSAVVAAETGFWLLLCDDVRIEKNLSVEQATDAIAPQVAKESKAKAWSEAEAKSLLAAVKNGTSLEDAVKAWNADHKPKGDTIPGGPTQAEPPVAEKEQGASETKKTDGTTPDSDAKDPAGDGANANEVKATQKADGDATTTPAEDTLPTPKAKTEAAEGTANGADTESGTPQLKLDTTTLKLNAGDRIPGTIELDAPPKPSVGFSGALRVSKSPLFGQRQSHTFASGDFDFPASATAEQIAADRPVDADDEQWAKVPGVGVNPELMGRLFSSTQEKPLIDKVYASEDGQRFYVIQLSERKAPEISDDTAQEKAEMQRKLRAQRQREAYKAWYVGILAAAEAKGGIQFEETYKTLLEQVIQKQQRRTGAQGK